MGAAFNAGHLISRLRLQPLSEPFDGQLPQALPVDLILIVGTGEEALSTMSADTLLHNS